MPTKLKVSQLLSLQWLLHNITKPAAVLQMKVSQWLCGYLEHIINKAGRGTEKSDAFVVCWIVVFRRTEMVWGWGGVDSDWCSMTSVMRLVAWQKLQLFWNCKYVTELHKLFSDHFFGIEWHKKNSTLGVDFLFHQPNNVSVSIQL